MTLYEQLQKLSKSDMLPLHMPGHKRSHAISGMADIYDIDITEIDGFDDLHHPEGILADMASEAAGIYGAKKAFLSVGGSSAANQAAIMAACTDADSVIIDRGCHKSVYFAVELAGLMPKYIESEYLKGTEIGIPVTAELVQSAMERNPETKTVVITSPTYEGLIADTKTIAEVVHSHDGILIVDAAHGAHLGLTDMLPDNPVTQGADLVVTSLHKMLPSPTQTALLLVGNDCMLDAERIQHYMSVFQSSSPSYVLMAGIGECLRYLKELPESDVDDRITWISRLKEETEKLVNLTLDCIPPRINTQSVVCDPFKIVICSTCEFSGADIYRILIDKYHIQCEMYAGRYVLAMLSIMDTEADICRLRDALLDLDEYITAALKSDSHAAGRNHIRCNQTDITKCGSDNKYGIPEMAEIPGEAMKKPVRYAEIDDMLCGCIAADYVFVYPPGIPIIVPGEIYDKAVLEYITKGLECGLNIIGIHDNKYVRIVK